MQNSAYRSLAAAAVAAIVGDLLRVLRSYTPPLIRCLVAVIVLANLSRKSLHEIACKYQQLIAMLRP